MPEHPTPIFVYGTLRHGLRNHYLLADGRARLVARGQTDAPMTMHTADVGDSPVLGVPFLCAIRRTHHVRGEVYAVDLDTLARLDRLEGHPHIYQRRPVAIRTDDGDVLACEAYFFDGAAHLPASPTGDYAEDCDRQRARWLERHPERGAALRRLTRHA
jgi:gamma-glutamylaminecyclotransferase